MRTFDRSYEASVYLYINFVTAVVVDSTIAISLCFLLFHSRTGVKKTDTILKILMAFSINTGLLTRYVLGIKSGQSIELDVKLEVSPHWSA